MDFDVNRDFLLWIKDLPEVLTWDYFKQVENRTGRTFTENEYDNMVRDLLDDGLIESALDNRGWGVPKDSLPLRLRGTNLGRRVIRRYDGRVDRWREAEQATTAGGMIINVGGSVTGSQIGMAAGDVTQTQNNTEQSVTGEARELLQRALEEMQSFELDEDDQDALEGAARSSIRELESEESEADTGLPTGTRRRLSKVASILGRVATNAAGKLAADEILNGIHQVLT